MFIKMLSGISAEISVKNKKKMMNYLGLMILVQDRCYWHVVFMCEYF